MYPDVKLLNYVGAILAHQTVVPTQDAFDVLFVFPPDQQTILEGSTFTMFFIDPQGDIVTPPLDGRILDSITRRESSKLLQKDRECEFVRSPSLWTSFPCFRRHSLLPQRGNLLPGYE